MIDIKDIYGNILLSVPVTEECERVEELMKSDYIQLSWNSGSNATLPIGSYIEYKGEKFSLLEPYTPEQKDEVEFNYKPQFQSRIMAWGKMPFFMYTYVNGKITSREPDWSLTDNPTNFMSVICRAIENETNEKWTYSVDASLPASTSLSFQSVDVFSALNQIASAFETEWWVDKANNILYLSKASHGEPVILEVGKNIGTPSVTQGKEGYYTRFYAFGSTRNIAQDYKGSNVNNLVNKRLTLDPTKYPNGYKDIRTGLKLGEIFSKILFFDDVYPSSKLTIKDVRFRLMYRLDDGNNKVQVGTDKDGNPIYDQYSIWYFQIPDFKFVNKTYDKDENPDGMLISGKELSVNFQSGALQGREFKLTYHESAKTISNLDGQTFKLKAGDYEINFIDESSLIIPMMTGLIPDVDDEIILFNIKMPNEYISSAYLELESALNKEIERLSSDLNNYQFKSNPILFKEKKTELSIGRSVTYKNGGYSYTTRVIKLTSKIDYDSEQEITIGNENVKGNTQELKEEVASANKDLNLLTTFNEATASLQQSYIRTQNMMMEGFAAIKNIWQLKEDDNGNRYAFSAYDVVSSKGISALGVGSTESGSTGSAFTFGELLNIGEWADKSYLDDMIAYKPANGTHWLGKKLSDIVGLDEGALGSYLTNHNYATQTWVGKQGYLTSHQSLAGYATETWVNKQILDNKYTLPTASSSVLGGVKIGANINIANGVISTHAPYELTKENILSVLRDENGLIYLEASLAVSGGLTALGIGSSGGGSFGALADLLDVKLTDPKADNLLKYDGTHWVNVAMSSIRPDLTGYATQSWVQQQGYLTQHQSLAGYATQSWVKEQKYLTQHQSLAGYATESFVNTKISEVVGSSPEALDTLYELAKALGNDPNFSTTVLSKIGEKENKLGNPSVNGYLLSSTTGGVRSWVAPYALPIASASVLGGVKIGSNISISGGVISTHDPYVLTKEKILSVLRDANGLIYLEASLAVSGGLSALGIGTSGGGSGASALADLLDVKITNAVVDNLLKYDGTHWVNIPMSSIRPDLTGYATQAWVKEQKYLTQHQSLAGYATESWTNTKLTGYVTTSRLNDLIGGASSAFDTLKEIEDYINAHQSVTSSILSSLSNKVDKVSGYALSKNDFTDSLKTKLDGIATGANKYVLPIAGASVLGGVKVGSNIAVDAQGVISVAAPYSLPTASASVLGGVKIGANINISGGVISTHAPYSLPTASASVLGGVKIGSNISISGGVISTHDPYVLTKEKILSVLRDANGLIYLEASLAVSGGLSALGIGSSGGGGAGLDEKLLWQILGNTGNEQISATHLTTALKWGNVSSKPTTLAGYGITDAMRVQGRSVNNCNDVTFRTPGSYGLNGTAANSPTDQPYAVMLVGSNIDVGLQIVGGYNSNRLAFRGWQSSGATYLRWNEVLTDFNYNNYVPSLTGGGASGTWNITSINSSKLANYGVERFVGGIKSSSSGAQATVHTADEFYTMFVNTEFAAYSRRGTWDYANNGQVATDWGNMHLAGVASYIWAQDPTKKTMLFITPANYSVGTNLTNEMMFYTSNGVGYTACWTRVLTSRNYKSYAPSLTGDNASGTWGIDISGTALRASYIANDSSFMRFHWSEKPNQPTYVWGGSSSTDMYVYNPSNFNVNASNYLKVIDRRSINFTPNMFDPNTITTFFSATGMPDGAWWSGIHVRGWQDSYSTWQLIGYSSTSNTNRSLYFRNGVGASFNAWKEIIDSSNFSSYAATASVNIATKARTLWNDSAYSQFHWQGLGGQPTYLWGGDDPSNMYVYNPRGFSVAYADNADTLDGYHRDTLFNSMNNAFEVFGTSMSIQVDGDKDTYYPVVIGSTNTLTWNGRIVISKALGSKTPSYPGNHTTSGSSMWAMYEGRANSWDGNSGYYTTKRVVQPYAKLLARTEAPGNSVGNLIVYLRGGGCQYNIITDYKAAANIYYTRTNLYDSSYPVWVEPTTVLSNEGIFIGSRYEYRVNRADILTNPRTLWGQSFNGSDNVNGNIASTYFHIQDSNANPWLRFTSDSVNWYIQAYQNKLHFGEGYAKSLAIDRNSNVTIVGKVGIGTDILNKTLNVNGSTYSSGYLYSNINGNEVMIGAQNGAYCHFMNSGAHDFYFNRKVVIDNACNPYLDGGTLGSTERRWNITSNRILNQGELYVIGGNMHLTGNYMFFRHTSATNGIYFATDTNGNLSVNGHTNESGNKSFMTFDYPNNIIRTNTYLGVATIQTPTITLAVGDGDTGFQWQASGVIQFRTDGTNPGYFNNAELYYKQISSINYYSTSWFRSSTSGTGWYHQLHGGGIYMNDDTYVKVYNGKRFKVDNANTDAFNTTGGYHSSWNNQDANTWSNMLSESNHAFNKPSLSISNGNVNRVLGWRDQTTSVGYDTRYSIASLRSGNNWGIMTLSVGNSDNGTSGYQLQLGGNGTMTWTGSIKANINIQAVGHVMASDWFRSTGGNGWFSEQYGGGIHMLDNVYVRLYNNKVFYNDGARAWGIGGHNIGLKLYQSANIGINLANASYTWGIYSNNNGNLYIGRRTGNVDDTSGSYIITVSGNNFAMTGSIYSSGGIGTSGTIDAGGNITSSANITANGGITALASSSSDNRLKTILSHQVDSISLIRKIGHTVSWKWNDYAKSVNRRFDNNTHYGHIANTFDNDAELKPFILRGLYKGTDLLGLNYEEIGKLTTGAICQLDERQQKANVVTALMLEVMGNYAVTNSDKEKLNKAMNLIKEVIR